MCVRVEPRRHGLYQSSSAALCLIEMGAVTELDICHLVRQLGQ